MTKRLSLWVLLLVAFQSQAFGQTPPGPVMLEPGDKVKIDVWQRPELSGEFDVGLDGRILHPLYQSVRVTGVPADQVEGMVRQFLSRFEADPQVVVQPLITVGVFGGVNTPAVHTLPPGATIGHALTAAGGVSPEGEFDDAKLRRKGGDETEIDLSEASTLSQLVRSGDQIMVEQEARSTFREVILPILHFSGTIVNLVNILVLR